MIIEPSEEVLAVGCSLWENSLVGQFVDATLSYPFIQHLVTRIWGKVELPTIALMENGLIIF